MTTSKPLTLWITPNCGKSFKSWEYQTTLPASWEIGMQVKKQQLEPDMEQQTGSKLGKKYIKAVYYHFAYLTNMQSTSWEIPGWMKHKLESGMLGEISITSDMQMTPPYGRKQRTKKPLESERGEWKTWLKTQHSENKDHGITSWQIDGKTMETVTDFILGGSKITADGDCSNEIKISCLLLGRKAMTNLDSILKNRDIILLTKVHLVKAMVFPVVMYGCESWTIKKAECRIDALELWCWIRLLRVPWTARRSIQSILKEISPEYSFQGLMLQPRLQYIGHLMQIDNSLEKTDAGKDWKQREKVVAEDGMVR